MRTVLQHDETDCAAACLAMILRKKVPSVLHTVINGREHYIVLSQRRGSVFHIQDPAKGFLKIKAAQLEEIWTGNFFIFSPTLKFKKSNDQSNFLNFLSLLSPFKKTVAQIFGAGIVLSAFGIAVSFYFRFLIDEVLYSQIPATLNLCSVCYLIVIIFQAVIDFCRNELVLLIGTKIDVMLTGEFFYHLLRLPMDFFSSRKTGEILSRLTDSSIIKNAVSSSALSVAIDSVMIVLGGAFLIKLGTTLIIAIIVPVLISSLVVYFLKTAFHRRIKEQAVLMAERNAFAYESINGIATIKALSTEKKAFEKCEELIVDCDYKHLHLGRLGNMQNALQKLVSACGRLAIYWYGSYLIFDGKITLGQLISFSILSNFFLSPLTRLLTMQSYWQEVFVSSERLADVLALEEECQNEDEKEEVESLDGDIKFENVSFSYGTRGRALDNVSFTVPNGKKVAFVGMSGSGKTTLIKLLMRFFTPADGKITIGGRNIADYKTGEYRKRIGYVPQECLLFSGTIKENILWGADDENDNGKELMIKAAKEAQAYDFIEELPQKFQTLVGEQGASLSGGERQRIALARVLATKHDVLVMDEATASLDGISERAIMDCLFKNDSDKTTIMVAHRLSTVRNCDLIFVFEKGKLCEQGSHDELMSKNGKYAFLWRAQNENKSNKTEEDL